MRDVRRAVSGEEPALGPGAGTVGALVRGVEEEAANRLAEVSLRELCERERGAAAGRPPEAPQAADRTAGRHLPSA
jgi:hypothetical protein